MTMWEPVCPECQTPRNPRCRAEVEYGLAKVLVLLDHKPEVVPAMLT